jgi:hypothetical protein
MGEDAQGLISECRHRAMSTPYEDSFLVAADARKEASTVYLCLEEGQ